MRVLEKNVGPRATAVNLKILHPFKHPRLGVMSFEQMKISFNNCAPCLLAEMGKDYQLNNRALMGWTWRHMTSFLTNQDVQFLYSPLDITLNHK